MDEWRNSRMVKSRGPDLPTLGSSSPMMKASDGGYQAGTPRRARISPKTIAQGRPECFGGPVVTNACAFYLCTRGYGCAKHPAFPAPSEFLEGNQKAKLGRIVPRDRGVVVLSSLQGAQAATCPPSSKSEGGSNPDCYRGAGLDCFAEPWSGARSRDPFAANDETLMPSEAPFSRQNPFPPVSKPIMVTDRSGLRRDGSFIKIKDLSEA